MRVRSFVAWHHNAESGAGDVGPDGSPGHGSEWREWRFGALRFRYVPRDPSAAATGDPPATLILGDDTDWDAARPDAYLAAGVPLRVDLGAGELVVHTSIVSLPPVFVYRGEHVTAITSDLHLLTGLRGVRLTVDPVGAAELGHFGHPVERRTLFRDVELAPAGSRLTMSVRDLVVRPEWRLPDRERLTWSQYVEAQIDAFTRQVERVDVSRSFLSLTAGLDTRTVFAALESQGRLIPAATMTGPRRSLDARIAERLCRAYGVHHEPIIIDERFTSDLPRYVETASRLSGGLASLAQAPEVFMYDRLGSTYQARLSGNLGNQVGRGGTEGVSVRGADVRILSPTVRDEIVLARRHWLLAQLERDDRAKHEFILQNEIPFTLVGNFTIGNHFAAQQTPYASRALIETLAARPATRAGSPSGSRLRMRLRDLRHRFLGEPEEHSFQRTLVKRIGGVVAHYPINWGWRAAGGVSFGGLALGGATLVGMFARAKGLDGGPLGKPLQWSGLPALHDFRESRRWLIEHLRDYTHDVLSGRTARETGLFDAMTLQRILDEHFNGRRDHYETITYALDLCLAHGAFCR